MATKKKKPSHQDIPKPRVFIGSASEALHLAQSLQSALERQCFVRIWTGVFGLGSNYLQSLIDISREVDFAILVFTPEDKLYSRGKGYQAARDNVIFEFGLFLGRLGAKRTYIVHPQGNRPKLPSDLDGLNTAEYIDDGRHPNDSMITPANQILDAIRDQFSTVTPGQETYITLKNIAARDASMLLESDLYLALTTNQISLSQYDELRTLLMR